MRLKLGMNTVPQNCTLDELRRVWRLADSSGFDWVSVPDHLQETPPGDGSGHRFEAMATLAALATETRNVRVGALVLCIGYRNPTVLAKAAVTIDHLSNGRLELGLGAGWYEMEHVAFGMPFPSAGTRMDMLEEGAQIIKSMLTHEETTFVGKHFRAERAFCFPRPVQKRLRIWIGGKGERRTLQIAARYGDGWNGELLSVDEFRHKNQVLDQWCQKEGRDPAEIERSVVVGFYMGANATDARRKRKAFSEQWRRLGRTGGLLFGTPREVVDRIGEYSDAGAQGLNINLTAPFDWETLQAFIEEVMPAFA